MVKSIEELNDMSIKEQKKYFNSLSMHNLKVYYQMRLHGELYKMMDKIYIKKRQKLYDMWTK